MSKNDSFAIVYTVKNEGSLLKYTIPYFLSQGASKIYIFWDGTTDDAPNWVNNYTKVVARPSVTIEELSSIQEWIKKLNPDEKMDHRKRINTMFAAEQANKEGIKWISCIDPDEMIWLSKENNSITSMLKDIPSYVEQVLMPNLELLPIPSNEKNPFLYQKNFIVRQDKIRHIWRIANKILAKKLQPNDLARIEHKLYRFFNKGMFPTVFVNPVTGKKIYRSLFLGYNNFKAFMRSDVAHQYNYNIHQWDAINSSPRSIIKGNILHYDLPSFSYFLNKFNQRHENMQLKVFDTRFQLGEIARNASVDVAEKFYNENICCKDENVREKLKDAGIIIEIDDIANFFLQEMIR